MLAINDLGKTPLELVGGAEIRDRFKVLVPLAKARLEKDIAEADASGNLAKPSRVYVQLPAVVVLIAMMCYFNAFAYRYRLSFAVFLVGPRFTEDVPTVFELGAHTAPLVTLMYVLLFEWGCMNGTFIFSTENVHSRMSLDPTHARFKRTCV